MLHICFSSSFKHNLLYSMLNNYIAKNTILLLPDDLSIGDISNPKKYSTREPAFKIIYNDNPSIIKCKLEFENFYTSIENFKDDITIWFDESPSSTCNLFYLSSIFTKAAISIYFITPDSCAKPLNYSVSSIDAIKYQDLNILYSNRRLFTSEQLEIHTKKWDVLKHENAFLRVQTDNDIVSTTEFYYDDEILSHVTPDISLNELIYQVAISQQSKICWGYINYRINDLIKSNTLIDFNKNQQNDKK